MSVVGFSTTGDSNQPSPSIWGDCPNTLLNDKGLGYFFHEDFLGAPLVNTTITSALLARLTIGGGRLSIDGDDDTVLTRKASEVGGYLDIETDGDDNDAAAIFSQPIGKIVRNSGNKVWYEARVEMGDVDADEGFFTGLVEEAGATRDVLADDVGADGVVTESLIGFLRDNGNDDALDIVYRKDNGTVVTVLADATNATAIPASERANLLDDTEVKVGIRFNGRDKIYFYVNGYEVASLDVDSTVDQSKNYCAIAGIKTGTTAAESFAIDWMRAAAQHRS